MILVDNFKVVLLVGLVICSIGIAPSSALKCKGADGKTDETCEAPKTTCKADATGSAGCTEPTVCDGGAAPADAIPKCKDAVCCCTGDGCNDLAGDNKKAICDATNAPACTADPAPGGDGPTTAAAAANGTATALFQNYYGGFPLVTLVSASMYYVPLKSMI